MASTSCLLVINGSPFLSSHSPHPHSPVALLKWGYRSYRDGSSVTSRLKAQAFRILANTNVSGKADSKKEIIMVDPLEAKRIAAEQMRVIKEKDKFKRQRQIEAINGAWAMIGLTASLVIEGRTGKRILDQLAGYWSAIVNFILH